MTLFEKYERAREEYLASLKIVSKSKETYAEYAFILGDFGEYVKAHGGEETEVPPLFIVSWRNKIKEERKLGNSSIRLYLTLLRSFFKWTIEHKIFTEQPVGKGDFPKKEAVEYDLLSEQEGRSLFLSSRVACACQSSSTYASAIWTSNSIFRRKNQAICLNILQKKARRGTIFPWINMFSSTETVFSTAHFMR